MAFTAKGAKTAKKSGWDPEDVGVIRAHTPEAESYSLVCLCVLCELCGEIFGLMVETP